MGAYEDATMNAFHESGRMRVRPTSDSARRLCAALVSLSIMFLADLAHAGEPWKTVPPTPALPAHAHEAHAEANGVRIWYAQWNEHAPGTPVLLLHGGYANSNYFGNLIPALAKHGYRVIAMDSRGHGRSTRNDAPYTYHLMADDVLALLDTLHIERVS